MVGIRGSSLVCGRDHGYRCGYENGSDHRGERGSKAGLGQRFDYLRSSIDP